MTTTITDAMQRYPNPYDTYLDVTKLIVVANSDVAWSLRTCQYYCQQRGIPETNILSCALGSNNTTWTPTDNAQIVTSYFTPVRTKLASISRPQGILLGPGVPSRVKWKDFWLFVTDQYVKQDGVNDYGYPSMSELAGYTRSKTEADFETWGVRADVTQTNFILVDDVTRISPILGYSYDFLGEANTAARYEEYVMPAGGTSSHRRTPEADTQKLGGTLNKFVPVGRIGWTAWSPYGVTESEATVRRAIDNATKASRTYNSASIKALPILVSLYNTSSDEHTYWSAQGKMLRDRGYNVKWAYNENQTPSVNAEANLPAAGASYTNADNITDFEYYLHIGTVTNHYADTNPNSWKPVLGASSVLFASFGYSQAIYDLANKDGAVSGITAFTHWTAGTSNMGIVHNLLRGFSYLEASYFAGTTGLYVPCGDPLYAPFAPERLLNNVASTKVSIPTRKSKLKKSNMFAAFSSADS